MSYRLATLFDQFLKERAYLKNVTPSTLTWYRVAFKNYRATLAALTPLPGHQADNITAFRSSTVVLTIQRGRDVLQLVFGRDGSVFVTFPYFKHRTGILSATTTAATGRSESVVNLEQGGRVTSHLVKYSHDPSGWAHFSQTGKIRKEVRRRSVPLATHEGHLFTVLINDLQSFDWARGPKHNAQVTPGRTVITVEIPKTRIPRER